MTKMAGFTLLEMLLVVCVIGVLAATSIPAYQDYTVRARLSEGLTLAGEIEQSVSRYYDRWGVLPKDNEAAGLPPAAAISGAIVTNIAIEEGAIVLRFGGKGIPTHQGPLVLVLHPVVNSPIRRARWCGCVTSSQHPPALPFRWLSGSNPVLQIATCRRLAEHESILGRPISLMAVLPLDVMLTCTVIACVVMILSGSFSIWLTKARGLEPIFVISQARYALAEDYAMTGDLRSIRDTTDHAIAPGRGGQQYINVGAAEIASLASGSGSSRLTLPFASPFRPVTSPGRAPCCAVSNRFSRDGAP